MPFGIVTPLSPQGRLQPETLRSSLMKLGLGA